MSNFCKLQNKIKIPYHSNVLCLCFSIITVIVIKKWLWGLW